MFYIDTGGVLLSFIANEAWNFHLHNFREILTFLFVMVAQTTLAGVLCTRWTTFTNSTWGIP